METEETAQEEEIDIQGWWKLAEERCLRVGELRRRLETDRIRVLRIMEYRSPDLILQQKAKIDLDSIHDLPGNMCGNVWKRIPVSELKRLRR